MKTKIVSFQVINRKHEHGDFQLINPQDMLVEVPEGHDVFMVNVKFVMDFVRLATGEFTDFFTFHIQRNMTDVNSEIKVTECRSGRVRFFFNVANEAVK